MLVTLRRFDWYYPRHHFWFPITQKAVFSFEKGFLHRIIVKYNYPATFTPVYMVEQLTVNQNVTINM